MSSSSLYENLKERGYVYQITHENPVKELLDSNIPQTFYLGIDPTADSLHIGHFFALMMFRHLQDAGHRGILVIGGATALIGDPSGKSDMRKMLSKEQVNKNLAEVKKLAERFVKTDGDNPAIILNNADWINPYSYVDFMREVGLHFNVSKMLAADAYSNRLAEGGLTFLEMGYMLMQAYDFVFLNKKYGCLLQIGGSDQWGNIVAGVNLARKLNFIENPDQEEKEVLYGLTCPLLMTKEGNKMGKTEHGTLWVAREKTTSYDFYQYFYNVDDNDTEMLLKLFTRIDSAKIESLCKTNIIEAKRTMAYEITKLVHGEDEANKVLDAVKSLFSQNSDSANIPNVKLDNPNFLDKMNVVDLLVATNFMPSKSEARRMILQGGILVDGNKIENPEEIILLDSSSKDHILLKKGKKTFLKVLL